MTTLIVIGLIIVVLVAAAVFLLVRTRRTAPVVDPNAPKTVADLVRMRAEAAAAAAAVGGPDTEPTAPAERPAVTGDPGASAEPAAPSPSRLRDRCRTSGRERGISPPPQRPPRRRPPPGPPPRPPPRRPPPRRPSRRGDTPWGRAQHLSPPDDGDRFRRLRPPRRHLHPPRLLPPCPPVPVVPEPRAAELVAVVPEPPEPPVEARPSVADDPEQDWAEWAIGNDDEFAATADATATTDAATRRRRRRRRRRRHGRRGRTCLRGARPDRPARQR